MAANRFSCRPASRMAFARLNKIPRSPTKSIASTRRRATRACVGTIPTWRSRGRSDPLTQRSPKRTRFFLFSRIFFRPSARETFMNRRFMITGGAGFIGSAVVRHLIEMSLHEVYVVDKLTYAGNLDNLARGAGSPRYQFKQADSCDSRPIRKICRSFRPDIIMHLASESHVDRSIDGPGVFIETNVMGTYVLLQSARYYWQNLDPDGQARFRFHHVSTDEVFGSLGDEGFFLETSPYQPNSPYSASKAASDHLVRAWHHTYGMPVVTSNCSNNYGPYHFPEKLIPLAILNALEGKPIPVYGDGGNIRDWLYVE